MNFTVIIITEEKVAMEYLLAQSGKGDLRPLVIVDEDIGNALPDFNIEEAYEDATEDNTLCFTEDIEELLATKDFGMLVYFFRLTAIKEI